MRVGQAGGVGIGGRGDDLLGGLGVRPALPGFAVEHHRAAPQRGEVGRAEAPARPGEHLHGRRTGGRVGDQPQHRNDLRHFGNRQQTGQADHFHRHAAGGEFGGDRAGVGVAAHQHRGGDARGSSVKRAAMWSAIQARSATTSVCSAASTVPGSASGRARSGCTAIERRRACAEMALANSSTRGGLRQLVLSSQVGAGLPSACGKSVVNRGRFVADAPRQP